MPENIDKIAIWMTELQHSHHGRGHFESARKGAWFEGKVPLVREFIRRAPCDAWGDFAWILACKAIFQERI